MGRGYFITFEGLDGSGKSTQIRLLAEHLRSRGWDVLLTREPGGTPLGEKIRSVILDPANEEIEPLTEAYLYAACRAQLVRQRILPALEKGQIVICDRYVDSSIAYQGYGRELGDAVEELNGPAVAGCMPEITFLLRIDPGCGRGRVRHRSAELDRIELQPDEFHSRTFRGYEEIAARSEGRIVVIDGLRDAESIGEEIRSYIDGLLEAADDGEREEQ